MPLGKAVAWPKTHNGDRQSRIPEKRADTEFCGWHFFPQHSIEAGKLLPMNIEELQVHGSAMVTAVDDCPEIADGEGSVVTARFITREVNTIARVTVARLSKASNLTQAEQRKLSGSEWANLAELGLAEIETLEGTPIHPIWSVDRNDWVPLGELTEGETLQAASGIATVLSLALVTCSLPVYNIEVHGEHVYQVGELGLLVHNACHHFNPVAFGNDIPYGHKLLTNLSDAAHSKVHTAMNAFLKAEHGKTLYAGKQWWTSNVRWQDRYKTMIKFYREFDNANNTDHFARFMAEVRGGIRSGFNPLGR